MGGNMKYKIVETTDHQHIGMTVDIDLNSLPTTINIGDDVLGVEGSRQMSTDTWKIFNANYIALIREV